MDISYQYEARYTFPTRTAEFRGYQPDFYLPKYNLCVEHFGIDRQGNTAPYIDRHAYHEEMAWKRALHQKYQTRLLETFHYETTEGTLLQKLEERLKKAGVTLNPLPDEAILDDLRQLGAISQFSRFLADLLIRQKAIEIDNADWVHHLANHKLGSQVQAALKLLQPIRKQYDQHLTESSTIDFEDMIGKAIDYVENGQFHSPWSHILVDEFQDISKSRARLIKALRDSKPSCSLFCVGDDWQSIYRFAGSDLSLTTHFEEEFGATQVTVLDQTFRFNDNIMGLPLGLSCKIRNNAKKR
jgi:DNA helicase-4